MNEKDEQLKEKSDIINEMERKAKEEAELVIEINVIKEYEHNLKHNKEFK